MHRLFIADLHLSPCSEKNKGDKSLLQKLIHFNQDLFDRTEEVYFLGDVFDYWVGMDHGQLYYHPELTVIRQLSQSKKCFFMRGNRDVLFSEADANNLNLTLLEDPYILTTSTEKSTPPMKILLTHGDAWTTKILDSLYRRLMLSPALQHAIHNITIKNRVKLAHYLRRHSRGNKHKDHPKYPHPRYINQQTIPATQLDRLSNFDRFTSLFNGHTILCGHFHRPGIYQHKNLTFYQLGDLRDDSNKADNNIHPQFSIYALITSEKQPTPTFTLLKTY